MGVGVMNTDVEICNMALARIGVFRPIASLLEASKEAVACSIFYAIARDRLLCRLNWPFATRRKALVLSGTAPDEWAYSYAYPADCLRVIKIDDSIRSPGLVNIPFKIEDDGTGTGRLIYTDQEFAEIIYTAKITAVPSFSLAFCHALAWDLAGDLAMPLANEPKLELAVRQRAEQAIAQAAAMDLNEEQPDLPVDGESVRSRNFSPLLVR
jgi:hypothetical protein